MLQEGFEEGRTQARLRLRDKRARRYEGVFRAVAFSESGVNACGVTVVSFLCIIVAQWQRAVVIHSHAAVITVLCDALFGRRGIRVLYQAVAAGILITGIGCCFED